MDKIKSYISAFSKSVIASGKRLKALYISSIQEMVITYCIDAGK